MPRSVRRMGPPVRSTLTARASASRTALARLQVPEKAASQRDLWTWKSARVGARIARQHIEQPQPSPVMIVLLQPHADLLRDATRGIVLGMDRGYKPLHPQLCKGVVATDLRSLRRVSLSPVLAQQVPANPRLNRAIDFMAHHAA